MNRTKLTRAVAVAFLGASLVVTAVPALSQPDGQGGRGYQAHSGQMSEADRTQMRERMQTRMNQRLERMAARLEIKASQQDAWNEYRQARASMFGATRPQRPAADADAATVTRFRAEMAQRRAQRMGTMADATAKLQEVLEPNQRKVLDEMSRRTGARGQGGKHRHGREGGHRHSHQQGGGRA
jgi:hypothetical protein